MKRIKQNTKYGNFYLEQNESSLDSADIAFLCMIGKMIELKKKRLDIDKDYENLD
jgi:hypothetical protein